MVNASGISSQSTPDREERQSAECPPDNKLPDNSQENLDARLDHAIEETFPTSDPVSVTITKGAGIDLHGQADSPASASDQQTSSELSPTEQVLDQVREALTTTLPGVPLRSPGLCTARASATRGNSASSILKRSTMFVRLRGLSLVTRPGTRSSRSSWQEPSAMPWLG
jgi:hypothetical protein